MWTRIGGGETPCVDPHRRRRDPLHGLAQAEEGPLVLRDKPSRPDSEVVEVEVEVDPLSFPISQSSVLAWVHTPLGVGSGDSGGDRRGGGTRPSTPSLERGPSDFDGPVCREIETFEFKRVKKQ